MGRTPESVVRIGVLTDMSGSAAENSGQGCSVVAAKLAVQDAGGKTAGAAGRMLGGDVGHDAG